MDTHVDLARCLLLLSGCCCLLAQVFFIVGEFVLVIIAVTFSSWRGQFLCGAVVSGARCCCGPWSLESGRWLQVQGRNQEALQVRARAGLTRLWQQPGDWCAGCAGRPSSSCTSCKPAEHVWLYRSAAVRLWCLGCLVPPAGPGRHCPAERQPAAA